MSAWTGAVTVPFGNAGSGTRGQRVGTDGDKAQSALPPGKQQREASRESLTGTTRFARR